MSAPVKRLGDRTFGFVMAVVFLVVAGLIFWTSGHIAEWAIVIATALGIAAALAPGVLMPLTRLWMWLGHKLGTASNFVLLGTFFYLVVLPFGLAMRLFGRAPFRKRADPEAETYWTPVERHASPDTYPDMF